MHFTEHEALLFLKEISHAFVCWLANSQNAPLPLTSVACAHARYSSLNPEDLSISNADCCIESAVASEA